MIQAKIILASASSVRSRMLIDAGVEHTCDPADLDETMLKKQWSGSAQGLAQHLAEEKARAVSLRHIDHLVIGADQVLVFGEDIFDKPGTLEKAREQLSALRGGEHHLISAVSLARNGVVVWSHADQATLRMRSFSDAFLHDYLHRVGDQVTSSVGAYHFEGLGAQLFETIDGDFFTILGLPLLALLTALRAEGHLIP